MQLNVYFKTTHNYDKVFFINDKVAKCTIENLKAVGSLLVY